MAMKLGLMLFICSAFDDDGILWLVANELRKKRREGIHVLSTLLYNIILFRI